MDILFFIVSLLSLAGGFIGIFAFIISSKALKKYSSKEFTLVSGTIEDVTTIIKGKEPNTKTFKYPVLNFSFNNTEYHVQSGISLPTNKKHLKSNVNLIKIDDEVSIRIYQNDIKTAMINSDDILNSKKSDIKSLLMYGVFLIIIGIALQLL